jgi:alpha-D-ribose 1-methylphosphonate 5-triphosphate synthase subunit PhnH
MQARPQPHIDLSTLTPGFTDTVHDSQRVFRSLLEALSRPGTIQSLVAGMPDYAASQVSSEDGVPLAAFAALLALADFSTPVHLPPESRALRDAVRFYTGAPLTDDHAQAAFAYIHDVGRLPPLASFSTGEPETPQDAAMLFIRVDSLTEGAPRVWRGPGIRDKETVRIAGLPERFWTEHHALATLFPCGIDCYLVAQGSLIGLPRTTRVEDN